jgi:hypothetical protein
VAEMVLTIRYADDGSARFTGEETLRGSAHGQPGSWTLHHRGHFAGGSFADEATVSAGPGACGQVITSGGAHGQKYAYTVLDPSKVPSQGV